MPWRLETLRTLKPEGVEVVEEVEVVVVVEVEVEAEEAEAEEVEVEAEAVAVMAVVVVMAGAVMVVVMAVVGAAQDGSDQDGVIRTFSSAGRFSGPFSLDNALTIQILLNGQYLITQFLENLRIWLDDSMRSRVRIYKMLSIRLF